MRRSGSRALSLANRAVDAVTRQAMRTVAFSVRLGGRKALPGRVEALRPLDEVVVTAERILVVALAEIGDAVLLSPFLKSLRATAPGAQITLVVRPGVASLFVACPYVDEAVVYGPSVGRALRPLILPWRARAFAHQCLSQRRFDLAVIPRWDTDHYLATAVAFFSGAPRRIGFSERVNPRKAVLNAGFDTLLTDIVPDSGDWHEVRRHASLISALGGTGAEDHLEAWPALADIARADEFVHASTPTGGGLIALGVGASDPRRRWPATRFAELASVLVNGWPERIVVIGAASDGEIARCISSRVGRRVTPFVPDRTLGETAALLRMCKLFVGNDSGPLHLAAAAGVPCVEVSCHPSGADPRHHNAPERFGPWGVPSKVLQPKQPADVRCRDGCTSSTPHCILNVSVADAVVACGQLLCREITVLAPGSR